MSIATLNILYEEIHLWGLMHSKASNECTRAIMLWTQSYLRIVTSLPLLINGRRTWVRIGFATEVSRIPRNGSWNFPLCPNTKWVTSFRLMIICTWFVIVGAICVWTEILRRYRFSDFSPLVVSWTRLCRWIVILVAFVTTHWQHSVMVYKDSFSVMTISEKKIPFVVFYLNDCPRSCTTRC